MESTDLILLLAGLGLALQMAVLIVLMRQKPPAAPDLDSSLQHLRQDYQSLAAQQRQELLQALALSGQHMRDDAARLEQANARHHQTVETLLRAALEGFQKRYMEGVEQLTATVNALRQEVAQRLREMREEQTRNFTSFGDSQTHNLGRALSSFEESRREIQTRLHEIATQIKDHLATGHNHLNTTLEDLRKTLETRLTELQTSNETRLEQMRQTVDEKLQKTLEARLSESFRQVSERLEQVYKGLGEMQTLAAGVGDLKRVLTNVKTRGLLGEVQLGHIFESFLSPEQFARDVRVKPDSREMVEFAVKLPGRGQEEEVVWLPVDSKFPVEAYQRLVAAQESGDAAAEQEARKELTQLFLKCARDIRDKYIAPPHTTDFAMMFLPIEGLYAEALQNPGLAERLQREFRVIPAGPTTLAAMLNSLQMGFRTLAIEKRSHEVWKVLGAVKTEFGKFQSLLAKAKEQVDKAGTTLDTLLTTRSRQMARTLKRVESLPEPEAARLLNTDSEAEEASDSDRNVPKSIPASGDPEAPEIIF
ncbi:MAG: DNA recombination protein RmuC [Flavobacteriales bacterium]|nr:DNA recombination protein RmuC [Flavobacteriales bacterium]